MVDILYSVIAFTAVIIMAVLFAYAYNSAKNEKQLKQRKYLFIANVIFGLVDFWWGLTATGIIRLAKIYNGFTIAYFVFSTIVIFEWTLFSFVYMNVRLTRTRRIFLNIPIGFVVALVLLNPAYHLVFKIDPTGWNYISSNGQMVVTVIQIIYLLSIIHAAARKISINNDKYIKGRYASVIAYTVILIFACGLQFLFANMPFMVLGCMIAVAIVYARNIVSDDKRSLQETSEYYENESKEIYSSLEALSGEYVAIHLLYVKEDRQHTVRTNNFIDSLVPPGLPASVQIQNVMANITHPDFKDAMVEFVDLHTLPERMKGKERIAKEFIGQNFGWCVASIIRVQSDKAGNPTLVIHAVQSINDVKTKELEYERALQEALKKQNTIFEEMLRAQSNGVLAVEEDGNIIYVNDAGAKLMGYQGVNNFPNNIKVCLDNIEIDEKEAFREKADNLIKNHKDFMIDYSIVRDGAKVYISGYTKQVRLNDGRMIFIASLSDITRNKDTEAKLKILSETDALTGIDNRRSGEQKIDSMMNNDVPGMLCIIDVNKFKGINDTYGHHIGDVVLAKVAECIKHSFRDSDVVMRLGGDEFAVYAKELLDENVCKKCMEKLFDKINALEFEGYEKLKPTLSVGVAFYEGKKECTYSRLYQQADSVMYMSKNNGGNCFTIFRKIK